MTKRRRSKGPHRARWRKGLPVLPPGIWPDTLIIHTGEAARILGVDVRSLERQRAGGTGPALVPGGAFYGRTLWYRVLELLVWRNKIIEAGPMDRDSAWKW